jgi:hypothetical protein
MHSTKKPIMDEKMGSVAPANTPVKNAVSVLSWSVAKCQMSPATSKVITVVRTMMRPIMQRPLRLVFVQDASKYIVKAMITKPNKKMASMSPTTIGPSCPAE